MDALEFNKDIGDMNEAEARATLRDFRSKYSDGRDEYQELQEQVEQYKENVEDYKEAAAEAHSFFAEKAAEMKEMDEDTIKEKFTTSEIREELLGEAEFQLASPEEEPEEASEFDEKPEKSDNLPGDGGTNWYDEEAEQAVQKFTVQHDDY